MILTLLSGPIGAPASFGLADDMETFDPSIIGEGPDPFDDAEITEGPDPIPQAKRDGGE